jgi:hypothetical protein
MYDLDPTPYDIDDTLADSFPASDPPAWTPGIARLTPPVAAGAADSDRAQRSAETPTRPQSRQAFAA